MGMTQTAKIVTTHLAEGHPVSGTEIALRIDHALLQDATGTMVFLEFMAMNAGRAKTEVAVSYVDHNLMQADFRNADDHNFLRTAAAKHGLWWSKPGNGISHQVHLERFGVPGKTLLGSDSHTPTGGALGMLAIGAGGLDVARALAGQPFHLTMPKVVGIHCTGALRPWVAAKDAILELLRRFSVKGGVGKVFEYHGPGVATLDVCDRAVIANMGAELGLTGSVFPADERTREHLVAQDRAEAFAPLAADADAVYDEVVELDLSAIEPLIAQPHSPDNVVTVASLAGMPVGQVIVGSSANSGLKDLLRVSRIVRGKHATAATSFEINPGSHQVLLNAARAGAVADLIAAGARIHQSGCLGCIGIGQAPATGINSLRTFPRNFMGRSGTEEDQVYLCSPETAAAAALHGEVVDPRALGDYPEAASPERYDINDENLQAPPPEAEAASIEVLMGPNIKPFPRFEALPDRLAGPVLLKTGDNISTDDIMPAGTKILALRSNIEAISEFAFARVDVSFPARAREALGGGEANGAAGGAEGGVAGVVIGGENYGQGSSREHAAIAPRYLGVRIKIVKSFARIHKANLINFGILPLTFVDPADYDGMALGAWVELSNARGQIESGAEVLAATVDGRSLRLRLEASDRERATLLAGGALHCQ